MRLYFNNIGTAPLSFQKKYYIIVGDGALDVPKTLKKLTFLNNRAPRLFLFLL